MAETLRKSTINFSEYGIYEFAIVDTFNFGGKVLSIGSGDIWDFLKLSDYKTKDVILSPSQDYIKFTLRRDLDDPDYIGLEYSGECYEKDGTCVEIADDGFGDRCVGYEHRVTWAVSEDTNDIGILDIDVRFKNKRIKVGDIITSYRDPECFIKDNSIYGSAITMIDPPQGPVLWDPFPFIAAHIEGKYKDDQDKPIPPKPEPPEPEGKTYSIKEATLKSISDTVKARTLTSEPLSIPEGINAAINTLVPLSLNIKNAKNNQFVKISSINDLGEPLNYEAAYLAPQNKTMTQEGRVTIEPMIFYKWGVVSNLDIYCDQYSDDLAQEYMFQFQSGEIPTNLRVANVRWINEPKIEPFKTYQASILNDIGVIAGV